MTILNSRVVPVGIQWLAILLIGIGGFYITLFVSYVTVALGENAANYGVTASNLSHYLLLDVGNYLLPAVFALSASYALFSQKRYARILVIAYGCSALPAFQGIVSGHPVFLLSVMGAVAIYYMWQPRIKAYFEFI